MSRNIMKLESGVNLESGTKLESGVNLESGTKLESEMNLESGIWNLESAVAEPESRSLPEGRPKTFGQRARSLAIVISLLLLSAFSLPVAAQKPTEPANATALQGAQSVVAKQAALVTEFDVNGLKVLVKRRGGSLTVAAGLFIRGGARNITAENAGIEALMLDVASEASANFPRERLRSELARMGTVIGFDVNRDYSVLALRCTRPNFERSW